MKINLFSYQPADPFQFNFGELLMRHLLIRMGYCVDHYTSIRLPEEPKKQMLFGVGGMLNTRYYGQVRKMMDGKIDVWGTGYDAKLRPEYVLKSTDPFNIHMVRGPVTRKLYGLPESIPLGDPGYLTSMFWNPPARSSSEVLFVKFYWDEHPPKLKGITKVVDTLLIGTPKTMELQLDSIIADIASARMVFSSSMHGCIVAHSFGVPWCITPKSNIDIPSEGKWNDIFRAIDGRFEWVSPRTTFTEAKHWWKKYGARLKVIDKNYQESLIEAFPYDS